MTKLWDEIPEQVQKTLRKQYDTYRDVMRGEGEVLNWNEWLESQGLPREDQEE